jgi:signal peptidase II
LRVSKINYLERKSSFGIWGLIAFLIIFFDQLTKWAILKWIPLYGKIPINRFINITHQENRGAAFSFLADASGWQRWFFITLAVSISSVIVVWLWRLRMTGQTVLSLGLSLVLGGAIGNVIDRIILGHVIDFIQIFINGWPFPTFNVADSSITVGAILLIVDSLFLSEKNAKYL